MIQKGDTPWYEVELVCGDYGYSFATAKNKISNGTFPVETYKVGRKLVVDKQVHNAFFEKKRAAGLRALESTKR